MADDGKRGSGRGLSFSLPAIDLPPVRLPERFFHFLPPAMRRRERETGFVSHLLLALCVDLVDAALALSGVSSLADLVRTTAGTAIALVLFGALGLVYVWEVLAVLSGFGGFTAVPTATALVLARALR